MRLSCKHLEFSELNEIFDELVYLYSLTIKKEDKYSFSESEAKSKYHQKMLEAGNYDPFVLLLRHVCSYFLTVCSQKNQTRFHLIKKKFTVLRNSFSMIGIISENLTLINRLS